MDLKDIQENIPKEIYGILSKEIKELRPAQVKAIKAGLFDKNNLLVCTPTASGKTLIAELAFTKSILEHRGYVHSTKCSSQEHNPITLDSDCATSRAETRNVLCAYPKGKTVYIVPLKALANEKYKDFKKRYGELFKIALSIGDLDKTDAFLHTYDLIVCTAEKLDSLLRHHTPWVSEINTIIIDEIHLLNDPSRGPTLEILITMLRQLLPKLHVIALSATIGNQRELAEWLNAKLVTDSWRPVKLKKGVYFGGELSF